MVQKSSGPRRLAFEQGVCAKLAMLPSCDLAPSATGAAGLELRREPLPASTLVGPCAASLALNVLPLLEELRRCLRAARRAG